MSETKDRNELTGEELEKVNGGSSYSSSTYADLGIPSSYAGNTYQIIH